MSRQTKSEDTYLHESGVTSGDVQEHDYSTFAWPYTEYVVEGLQSHLQWSYGQAVPQQPYGYGPSGLDGHLIPGYQSKNLSYSEPIAYSLPEVVGYEPPRASPGSKLSVYIRSTQNLSELPQTHFFILFQGKKCNATLTKLADSEHYLHYEVATNVPNLDAAGWLDTVPLQLQMEDETGQVAGFLRFGAFTYEEVPTSHVPSTTEHPLRKRKISLGSPSSDLYSSKRRSAHHLYEMSRGQSSVGAHAQAHDFALSCAMSDRDAGARALTTSNTYNFPSYTHSPYLSATRAPLASHHNHQSSPRPFDGAFLSNVAPLKPQTTISRGDSKSPIAPTVVGARSASKFLLDTPKNPTFVRTLTVPSTSLPKSGSITTFNPYSIPNRPVLDIKGDLKDMLDDWTDEEQKAKRRLVQFEISQSDNTIKTCFKPVTLKERIPESVCISCIWWEEKQEAYVTSVDTIHLLESLVAVRFTTEEKNRIRRNLQAFKPKVVSKSNAETSQFFKVIMGFEKPRPRNIEKDTKVFPWKALMQGLKKIMGKYSASYASTAGPLLRSVAKDNHQNTTPLEQPHMPLSSPNPQPIVTSPSASRESVAYPYFRLSAPPLLQSQQDDRPETRWCRQSSDVPPECRLPGSWEFSGTIDPNQTRTTTGLAATPSAIFNPEYFAQSIRRPGTAQYYEFCDQQIS